MSKDSDLQKISLRVTKGTTERLNELFPTHGYNKVIRMLVDNFLRKIQSEQADSHTSSELKLTESELRKLED